MSNDNVLGQCKCLDKFEKDTLITALDTSMFHSKKILSGSEHGMIRKMKEELTELIGNYTILREIVDTTPIC